MIDGESDELGETVHGQTATGQNGNKKAKSKRQQVKMAKVKKATKSVMSVNVSVDLNAISIAIVVHVLIGKFRPRIEPQVVQKNRHHGRDSLANTSSDIYSLIHGASTLHSFVTLDTISFTTTTEHDA